MSGEVAGARENTARFEEELRAAAAPKRLPDQYEPPHPHAAELDVGLQ